MILLSALLVEMVNIYSHNSHVPRTRVRLKYTLQFDKMLSTHYTGCTGWDNSLLFISILHCDHRCRKRMLAKILCTNRNDKLLLVTKKSTE